MKNNFLSLMFLLLAGCASIPAQKSTLKKYASKYQVGDRVEYLYSGQFRKTPVYLTEEIIEKYGNRLTILVKWKSGDEERSWKQLVTDTPENQRDSTVDRLIQIFPDGSEKILANMDNRDLYKLYEGTYRPSRKT